ncbi:MAG TPA: ATP-binding protein [Methanosarcinales archaeon]|nr:ATP-binding protein [Methanosarcinales archaeon]
MKFYNREDEIRELHLLRNTPPAMIVLTGRRRVGKTELIKKFLEDSTGVYFFVDSEKSEKMLITEFSAQLTESFDLGEYVKIEDWETLLKLIFDIGKQKDVIVCIDEFQRFLQVNPSFISQLQKYWDILRTGSRVFFVLSGSSVGMMNQIFVEQKAPLFKRAQNIMFIEPFDFKTINSILTDLGITDPITRIEMYALFGGMIHYYSLIEYYGVKSTEDAISKLILRKFAPLKNEVRDTMIESFGREHRTYYSILTAIALGKTTKSEISDFVDVKATSLSRYMDDLMNTIGVVKREVPVTEPKPWRSKKGRYLLNDNFNTFWFRFIFRNMSHHEIGDFEYIREKIRQGFDSFVGRNFEGICREFLADLNRQRQLPFRFDRIGSWWNRKGDEIDIVALNSETVEILFAECKWKAAAVDSGVSEDLRRKALLVDWRKGVRREYFAVFSKSGFDESCLEYCEEHGVLTFDADQIAGTAKG